MDKITEAIFALVIIILFVFKNKFFTDNFSFLNVELFENDDVPTVKFPFKNLFDDEGNKLNIILIAAPFREEEHEKLYLEYKKKGLDFCGISSYLNFPDEINNPYEDKYHVQKNHDYLGMVSSWLYCMREPSAELKASGLPLLLLTEADLKDYKMVEIDNSIKKEYDFIYCCLKDNDRCDPGWQSYNRNWELAKKCLKVMCGQFGLKGVIVGRTNCDITDLCANLITIVPDQNYHDFQMLMKKSRFLFVPNVADASPRVITEAICYNMPVLVNYNIIGGWHNVIPGVTGEFFDDEKNISEALTKITQVRDSNHGYTPREWFIKNRSKYNSGAVLAKFLKKHYPKINNKDMKYAYITI